MGPTADFNEDGNVDGRDFLTWQRNMGTTSTATTFAKGDANFNGTINSADLTVFNGQFGAVAAATSSIGIVPEPAAATLAAAALLITAAAARYTGLRASGT
jgi:hypothetical protein